MTLQNINYGQAPDDGTGDKLRDAFKKTDDNFKQLELNKANSTDVITALEAKVDKVQGKGLSTEDFTIANRQQLDNLPAQLAGIGTQFSDVNIALGTKVDKVAGKSLSTNDFTDELKLKLAGLESSHFKGLFASLAALQAAIPVAVAGDYADVDLGAGQEVSRYLWDVTDSSWVQQAAPAPQLTAAQVKTLYESNPDTNAFTDSQELKLQGIEAGAQKNVPTNLDKDTTATQITVTSSTGQSVILPAATQASAGLLSAADKKKIDDIGAIGGELFDFMWHNGPRSSMDAGRIATDGQQISYLMYPQVCQAIWDGKQNAVSESVWQSDDSKINCWSTGDGSSWVRVPDLNAATGRGKPFYLRGGSDALNGTSVGDAIRNITGVANNLFTGAGTTGAFGLTASMPATYAVGGTDGTYTRANFDASRVVPTSDENRVKTAYGVWTVRVATVVSNSSAIDAAQLATQITTLDTKVQKLPTGGFKNKIINGKMEIAQRGTSFSPIGNGQYGLDRFITYFTGAAVGVSQIAGFAGFKNALRITGAAGNTGVAVGQRIEAVNSYDLVGKPITISFYGRASANTGCMIEFGTRGSLDGGATSIVKTATFTLTQEASRVSMAVTDVPSGAVNGLVLNIAFTGLVSGTVDITGVQLEAGEVATPFEHRPYGMEFAMCQRYYQDYSNNFVLVTTNAAANTNVRLLPVVMRATPTVIQSTPVGTGSSWGASATVVYQYGTHSTEAGTPILKLSAEL